MNKKGPTLLVILDGWGFSTDSDHNAIFHAHPATFHFLWEHYPHALLRASGSAVGLPEGIPGNSEVGHMTIGAGCIIEQAVTRINNAIHHATFFKNQQIIDVLQTCKEKNGRLHLLGLLSNGCVHSNDDHLFALMKAAHDIGIPHTYIHAFLDGRDVGPKTNKMFFFILRLR
jgi:2,3-bisphosphoglycerate-independent phosphoglycerate mutase